MHMREKADAQLKALHTHFYSSKALREVLLSFLFDKTVLFI